ncbi:hypothetical protein [Acetobacter syzygii]|uniref:hypothetical protein n=1 Tax=Acetobacter syzygii TaxID=146476 RepID=UPI0039EBF53A
MGRAQHTPAPAAWATHGPIGWAHNPRMGRAMPAPECRTPAEKAVTNGAKEGQRLLHDTA